MLYNIGRCYLRQGQFDNAIAQFNKIIQLNPNNEKVFFILGSSFEDQGDLAKAEDYYQRALKLDKDYVDACINLGLIYSRTNRLKEAINLLQHSMSAFWLGEIRLQLPI